jgi:trigger factor
MTQSPQELKNENLRVVVRTQPGCRVEFDVHAMPPLIEKARRAAIKGVGKEVLIPGFRKGKAPEEMIVKKFSAAIEKELRNELANIAYKEAQGLAQVPVLNHQASITFDIKKESPEGMDLVFSFETEPTIPSVNPSLFVPKPVNRPEVTEKQIEEAVRQVRFFFAEWKLIDNRPIQAGDYVMINLDTIEGDVPHQVFHQIRFEVSNERMANWMKQLVIGAKSGDVLEGMSEPDDTASEQEKKEFKPKKVRLTILKAEEATLPELTPEFTQKVGAVDAEAMRKSIEGSLNTRAEESVQDALRAQVNEFLIEKYPFELPHSLIQTEQKHRVEQQMQNPKFKARFAKMSQEERKKIETEAESEAKEAVRLFYLSRQIVRDAGISVTHQEVQAEAVAMLQSSGARNVDKISKEVFALGLSKVLLAKAQNHILATGTKNPA